jgi:hypothetical protein
MKEIPKWDPIKAGQTPKPARLWDMINPNIEKLPEEFSNARLEICKACPELIKVSGQCKKCGCVMSLKTQLPHATCPIGKWGALEPAFDENTGII